MLVAIPFFFFVLVIAGFSSALRNMPGSGLKDYLDQHNFLFFYYPIHKKLFSQSEIQTLYFYNRLAKTILVFAYTFSVLLITSSIGAAIGALALIVCTEALIEMLSYKTYKKTLLITGLFASLVFYALLPVCFWILKLQQLYLKRHPRTDLGHARRLEELIENMQDADTPKTDTSEHKLLSAVLKLKEKKVREVMAPRMNLFCLPEDLTIAEAIKECQEEGYSRVPIYKENIDQITGVLFVKDMLNSFAAKHDPQSTTIQSIARKPLFTPETKRVTQLLQEFRTQHTHLAIVVDEYGGTKGVVTIEDILEEIVGEIEDEYDMNEEVLFFPLPSGSFVVDATMSIGDISEKLGVEIPQEGDYDTIGGYIYHKSGLIPKKGYSVHTDAFDIEVLSSQDRKIEKVKLIPIKKPKESA